jgi:hypothetical protein
MSGDPTRIPLDIEGELARRGLSGKVTVIVEGLPTGGTLSAGTNRWDGTWSLGLEDLSGIFFAAPAGRTGGLTLTVRVLQLDSDGFDVATTAALFDIRVGDGAEGADLAEPAGEAAPAAQARRRSEEEQVRRDEKAEHPEMDETSAESVAADQRLTMHLMAQWHQLRGDRRCPLVGEFIGSIPPEHLPDCCHIKPGRTLDESNVSLGINVARTSGIIQSSLTLSEVPGNTLLGAAVGSLRDALKGTRMAKVRDTSIGRSFYPWRMSWVTSYR